MSAQRLGQGGGGSSSDRGFWLGHALLPALVFLLLVGVFELSDLDRQVANLMYDTTLGVWPQREAWWSNALLHTGGKYLVLVFWLMCFGCWGLTFVVARWRAWRRALGYVVLSVLLSTSTVTVLKKYTNMDCPWSLTQYGGDRPYLHLFEARSPELPAGRCFPAGHASGGYALLSLYFALLGFSRRWAGMGLAVGVGMGLAFGLGQQFRGAHFVSHDVWTAAICWFISLGLYRVMLWPGRRPE